MKNQIVTGIKNGILLQAKLDSSALVFDVKPEIFYNTCSHRKFYNSNVYSWSFANPEKKTHLWNPHILLDPLPSCIKKVTVIK